MIFAIDLETTGLNPYLGDRAFLITWHGEDGSKGHCFWGQTDATVLDAMLINPANEWVMHNAAFDIGFLEKMGFKIHGKIHCTLIAAHLFNPLEESKGLKRLAKKYLNRENPEEQELDTWFNANGMRGENKRQYIKVPEALILKYAMADVEMTMGLWRYYKATGILDTPVYKAECELIPVVVDIVRQGMKVDREFAKTEAERTTKRVIELVTDAKVTFDINSLGSDEQIAEFLMKNVVIPQKLDLADLPKTKTGALSTAEDALDFYEHPAVPLIIEYRELVKMNSTYLQPMLLKTDAEDRIHASLNQTGARTGRFSSSNPNIQNIPRSGGCVNIRRGFIVKDSSHKLLLIDLSQIELRVLAHYCQEPAMVTSLRTRNGDLHADTSIMLFEELTPDLRDSSKEFNFASIYGAGAPRLLKSIKKRVPTTTLTLPQVKSLRRKYFEKYPNVRNFLWKIEGMVKERGMRNRVGYVDGLSKRRYYCEVKYAYRIANYLIQGESAMFFKSKMLAVHKFLEGKKSRLINVVHDEMIFDLHESEVALIPDLLACIEDHTTYRVPIFANAKISDTNWSEKRSI